MRSCTIHNSLDAGIGVSDGASPLLEDNQIWANAFGIVISGVRTDPLVRGNRVHDGEGHGIWVYDGADATLGGQRDLGERTVRGRH